MHYYSLNEYLRSRFGEPVYKLSLNGGMTCPNRDGTLGTRGCIFCSSGGSGEFAASADLDINSQIDSAKSLVIGKTKAEKFIAYFQPFTNTYAEVSYLEKLFMQAIQRDDICALSIATRPDCLENDKIQLLSRLNKIKPVFVELGLQTIHSRTAHYIRRGYELCVFDKAVSNLKAIGVNVVVHLILGLPGESREDMLKSVSYVAHSGADGIKLQLLHLLKGTDLASDYEKKPFHILSLDEYAELICECIELLPKDMVVHRITGDGDKKLLIEPKWSGNKRLVLNTINKALRERNVEQGSRF
ncbi:MULTISPECIES: TIGR01212 family radical SAM protein [unclassified Ruminococcus]|uniref:TIGR01212 family radical SAM protein n=1 Tax=unclassified Ruminococcus TaxID=2608920 RepID=UPI00210E97EC|nr:MULTISPECIES: TIGR01212 family radical SAM protein [unclassified Ruminococcus]MCQ4022955.1 TIGR01212 family radical SAM protein [Ruminococcus sp. zg-924]MCQ4115347.1 TIGR01212 family radical SAM protein [Ruminococcus sp. zg-921]